MVNRPELRIQIDAKALAESGEMNLETFRAVSAELVHFHANEPGFGVLGTSGSVDHAVAGTCLREIRYTGFVSIEQKMIDPEDPISAVKRSLLVLNEAYA